MVAPLMIVTFLANHTLFPILTRPLEGNRELYMCLKTLELASCVKMALLTLNRTLSPIVISVGLFGHFGDSEVWENMDEGTLTKTKEMLDDMHKRKIDMADEIFVINVGGYIGESTRSEIEYAKAHGKKIRYLEG